MAFTFGVFLVRSLFFGVDSNGIDFDAWSQLQFVWGN